MFRHVHKKKNKDIFTSFRFKSTAGSVERWFLIFCSFRSFDLIVFILIYLSTSLYSSVFILLGVVFLFHVYSRMRYHPE